MGGPPNRNFRQLKLKIVKYHFYFGTGSHNIQIPRTNRSQKTCLFNSWFLRWWDHFMPTSDKPYDVTMYPYKSTRNQRNQRQNMSSLMQQLDWPDRSSGQGLLLLLCLSLAAATARHHLGVLSAGNRVIWEEWVVGQIAGNPATQERAEQQHAGWSVAGELRSRRIPD